MRVEYTRRAIADLRKVSADSSTYGGAVLAAVEARIHRVIDHISERPLAARQVAERPGVHVIPLIRYPYKVFYRVFDDRIRILHIRHTSRRPWTRSG
jgi:plasmid stabilization system protein ParE